MNSLFWLGLAIGAVLSLVASIAANLMHNRIIAFVDNRKLASQSSRFSKAQKFHKLVTELHNGSRDRYLYFATLSNSLVAAVVLGFLFLMFSVVLQRLVVLMPENSSDKQLTIGFGLLSLFSSLVLMMIFFRFNRRYHNIINAIDSYDRFDTEFKQRWASRLANTTMTPDTNG